MSGVLLRQGKSKVINIEMTITAHSETPNIPLLVLLRRALVLYDKSPMLVLSPSKL